MNKKSLILGILAILVFVGGGFFALTRSNPSASTGGESANDIWEQTIVSLAKSIAHSTVDFVIDNDNFVLAMYVDDISPKIKGYDYLIIVNKDGKMLTHPDSSQVMQDYGSEGLTTLGEKQSLVQFVEERNLYDVSVPVLLEDIRLGEIHLGIENPFGETTAEASTDNMPRIILFASAFIGLILIIFGSIAPASIKPVTPTVPNAELTKLKKENSQLEATIGTMKKRMEELAKQKAAATGDEAKVAESIAKLREEETKLAQSIDDKKAQLVKLEQEKEAMATQAQPQGADAKEFRRQLEEKDNEINNLQTQIENLRAQAERKEAAEEAPEADVEALKKEELELTQRIVKKRREEIILSQRVEAKRKEELALERKIEALKKNLNEMGS
jgi:peptidoglycan hydrolase CwlO-like protein